MGADVADIVAALTYASVCDGIGAAHAAWKPLGWRPLWLSEIAPFPSAVTAHRHPEIPNHGDLLTLREKRPASPDVLIGGTPCQSFSVAGLRGGLADPRGNLALAFVALVDALRPRWILWENVPGVLSVDGGRAFGSILGGLAELGYGFAWRVLDAQYHALAQRRERVFVVASPGDWRRAAAVLLEPEGVRRDSPPSREAGQGVAGAARVGPACGRRDRDGADLPPVARSLNADGESETFVTCFTGDGVTADPISANESKTYSHEGTNFRLHNCVAHTLRAEGFDASEDGTGRGPPLVPVAFSAKDYGQDAGPLSPTLRAGTHRHSHANGGCGPAVALPSMRVRRLMPVELERLQGFPDGYTDIPWRGKPGAPDGPRAKALGNSMAVPCIRWIGRRIEMVDALAARGAA
jgi:DNA (cytosine-5)-methyltransferase 1